MRQKTKIALFALSLLSLSAGTFVSATLAHIEIVSRGKVITNSILVKARDSSMEISVAPRTASPLTFTQSGNTHTLTSDISVVPVSSEFGDAVYYKRDQATLDQGQFPYADVTDQEGYYVSYNLTVSTKAEAATKSLYFKANVHVPDEEQHLNLNDTVRLGVVETEDDFETRVEDGFLVTWGNVLLTNKQSIVHVNGTTRAYTRDHSRCSDEKITSSSLSLDAEEDHVKYFRVSIWVEGITNYSQEDIRGVPFNASLEAMLE